MHGKLCMRAVSYLQMNIIKIHYTSCLKLCYDYLLPGEYFHVYKFNHYINGNVVNSDETK